MPFADSFGLPEQDFALFGDCEADGQVAAFVNQLHVFNLG